MRNSLASGAYLKRLNYFKLYRNICDSSCEKNADSGCSMRKTFMHYSIVFLAWDNRLKLVVAPFKIYNVLQLQLQIYKVTV